MVDFLSASGDTYEISVDIPEEAGIPKGAELHVSEISEFATNEADEKYVDVAAETLELAEEEVKYVKLLDIFITKDGEKVQPKVPVSVKIKLLDKSAAKEEAPEDNDSASDDADITMQVVHFGENETAKLDCEENEEELSFDTDGFSVFAIVGTEVLTTDYITASGDTYEITVSYDADANIPEGAQLEVSEVSRTTKNEDGEYYVDLAEDLLNVDRANDEGIILFDISIVKDGAKVQPEAPVSVEVKLNDKELIGTEGVVHFGDSKTEVLDASTKGEAVSFETSSFSIYAFKDIDPNEDGTYDLTLSVAGSSSSVTTYTDINVIFVEDISNSMRYRATSEYGSYGTFSNMNSGGDDATYYKLYKSQSTSNPVIDGEEYTGPLYYYVSDGRDSGWHTFSTTGTNAGKRVSGLQSSNPYSGNTISGPDSRLAQTNAALKTVMDALAAKNTSDNPDAVEMQLITFSGGTTTGSWVTSTPTLPTTTSQNTYWSEALSAAKTSADSKAAAEVASKGTADQTYIIFLTDGKPTNGHGGTSEATSIMNDSNIDGLYLIFAYGSTSNYNTLAALSHTEAYNASSTETLVTALTSILGQINNASSYEQVVYNDGVTSLTSSLVAKDVSNVTYMKYPIVYQKDGKYYYEDTSLGEDEVPSANVATSENSSATLYYDKTKGESYTGASTTYENNVLSWDLSSVRLENGWLYTTSFTVWPSQAAYDLVADLNNGAKSWSDLTDAEKASIEGTPVYDEDGETIISYTKPYSLKTNTDDTKINYNQIDAQTTKGKLPDKVTQTTSGYSYDGTAMTKVSDTEYTVKIGDTTYTLTIDVGTEGTTYTLKASTPGTTPVENPDPVALADGEMAIKKIWDDEINDRNKSLGVNFYVWMDGSKYQTKDSAGNTIDYVQHLTESNNWSGKVVIAPGVMTLNADGTLKEVLETGHNYKLTEEIPADEIGNYNDYGFEFTSETVRPMMVNGELQYLVLVTADYPAPSGATTYTIETMTVNGRTVTGGTYYVKSGSGAASLNGTNHKTSELDITKEIDSTLSDKTSDELDAETFTYTVTLNSPANSHDNGVKLWIYTPVESGGFTLPEYGNLRVTGSSEDITFSGNTVTKTVTINRTQIIRFTNLPTGTTYTITETGANGDTLANQGYVIAGVGQGTTSRPAATSGTSATGTIEKTDTRYYNNFKNKLTSVDAELKVTKALSGYEWNNGPESYEFTVTADEGVPMPENTTVTVTSADALTATFGEVRYTEQGTYVYTITETNAGKVIDGIEYGAAQTITVTVARNNDGTLSVSNIDKNYTAATATAPASGRVEITNTWAVTQAYATKIWENADGTDTAPTGAKVTFTLYQQVGDGEATATNYTVELNGEVDAAPTGTAAAGYESEIWKAMFVNLPKYDATTKEEIKYTIRETEGYESYEMDPETAVASGGTITNKQISTPIEITKIGDFTLTTTLSGVQFKVFADKNCTTQLLKDSTGAGIGTAGLITTGDGGKAAIGSFVTGTYYLQEVKAADGYNMLSDVIEFTVNADGTVTYSIGNSNFESANKGSTYAGDDGVIGLYVNNPSGAELPMTGGPGTLLYTLSGLALILASAMMYGFRMRRRERRWN